MPTSRSLLISPPLLVRSQHALLRPPRRRVWVLCRGYPLVNVTCLSATLALVNCPDYYCDNVAIKKRALHQRRRGRGLWAERRMLADYEAVGKALRWSFLLTPPRPLRWTLLSPVLLIWFPINTSVRLNEEPNVCRPDTPSKFQEPFSGSPQIKDCVGLIWDYVSICWTSDQRSSVPVTNVSSHHHLQVLSQVLPQV